MGKVLDMLSDDGSSTNEVESTASTMVFALGNVLGSSAAAALIKPLSGNSSNSNNTDWGDNIQEVRSSKDKKIVEVKKASQEKV